MAGGRFPYAYYRQYFDGPIHGESFRGQMLILDPESIALGGEIDVSTFSHIVFDSTAGNITVNGFSGGEFGQLLYIVNKGTSNKVILQHAGIGTEQIESPTAADVLVEPHHCVTLMRMDWFGVAKWLVLESSSEEIARGSQVSPSLYVGGDRDTGLFSPGENSIGITTAGVSKLIAYSTYLTSLVSHRFYDGTIASPSITFNSDPDTGFYRQASGDIGFSVDGVHKMAFKKAGTFATQQLELTNRTILSDMPVYLQTNSLNPQGIFLDHIGVGSDYALISGLIPLNGIYAEGSIRTSGEFIGTATSAKFADLAERYHGEPEMEPGDVVALSGGREITKASILSKEDILGVISTDPAFKMNDQMQDAEDYPFVAMTGRVPCKVKGPVRKGQRLIISDEAGIAEAYTGVLKDLSPFEVVGRSLITSLKDEVRKIEIVVGRL